MSKSDCLARSVMGRVRPVLGASNGRLRNSPAIMRMKRSLQGSGLVVRMRRAPDMADRTVHYEAAFEAFLRERGIPYVAVDEAKKALFANAKLKSFDFVVYSKNGPNLLVDVKGRQCRDRTGR